MKGADIKDDAETAYLAEVDYHARGKVVVLEKAVRRVDRGYGKPRHDGVRVRLERTVTRNGRTWEAGQTFVIASRAVEGLWTAHDEAKAIEQDALIVKMDGVRDRLRGLGFNAAVAQYAPDVEAKINSAGVTFTFDALDRLLGESA